MNDMNLKNEPDLGYIFFPAAYDNAAGHPRLDVVMNELPTSQHFDPIFVGLWAKSRANIGPLSVHHPWSGERQHQVLPGRIVLHDRQKKEVEAFTFGATLQINSNKKQTICVFTSPVPILHLISTNTMATDFADEVEGFLARCKAKLGHEYAKRAAEIDPLALYNASLDAIMEKFASLPSPHTGERAHFRHWLPKEIKRLDLAEQRPLLPKTIDDLFGL